MDDILTQLVNVLETGTEEEARAFLTDRYLEFPEDIREKIGFALLAEAFTKQASDISTVHSVQSQGLTMLDALASIRKELENQARIEELHEELKPKS